MSFDFQQLQGFSGNLCGFCFKMTQIILKPVKIMNLNDVFKTEIVWRLPPVQFIRLSSVFVIKIKHRQGQKGKAAEIALSSYRNNITYRPIYS